MRVEIVVIWSKCHQNRRMNETKLFSGFFEFQLIIIIIKNKNFRLSPAFLSQSLYEIFHPNEWKVFLEKNEQKFVTIFFFLKEKSLIASGTVQSTLTNRQKFLYCLLFKCQIIVQVDVCYNDFNVLNWFKLCFIIFCKTSSTINDNVV